MAGKEGAGGVEYGKGSIVWVRRRNGRWWPGIIVGEEELSSLDILCPRSGTPVKLLGKEDAIVDWYNLEKSIRVKAFRCGEFDECIMKAESHGNNRGRKREKYARQEDAIRHALELEREQHGRKQIHSEKVEQHLCSVVGKTENGAIINCKTNNCHSSAVSGNEVDTKSVLGKKPDISRQVTTFHELDNTKQAFIPQTMQAELAYKNNASESIPQMRALKNFCIKKTSPKNKSSSPDKHDYRETVIALESCKCNCSPVTKSLENGLCATCFKGCCLSEKRKRINSGHKEGSSVKRRDRRRPLSKVLQTSAKFLLPENPNVDSLTKDPLEQRLRETGKDIMHFKQPNPSHSSESSIDISESSESLLQISKHVTVKMEKMFKTLLSYPASAGQENLNCSFQHGKDPANAICGTSTSDSTTYILQASENINGGFNRKSFEEKGQGSSAVASGGYNVTNSDSCLSIPVSAERSMEYVADIHSSEEQLNGKHNVSKANEKNSDNKNSSDNIDIRDNEPDDTCGMFVHTTFSENILKVKKALRPIKMEGQISEPALRSLEVRKNEAQYLSRCNVKEEQRLEPQLQSQRADTLGPVEPEVTQCEEVKKKRSVLLSRNSSKKENVWVCEKEDNSLQSGKFLDVTSRKKRSLDEVNFKQREILVQKSPKPSDSWTIATGLIDIDIDVKASYQREHVPIVSLMSKLNNKAIIGHPVTVEVLKDGSSETMVIGNNCLDEDSLIDVKPYYVEEFDTGNVQPVWKTARRTAMQRTPRQCSLKIEPVDPSELPFYDSRPSPVKSSHSARVRNHSEQINGLQKQQQNIVRPKRTFKRSGLPLQKTKRLSSITMEHALRQDTSKYFNSLKPPETNVVSCIPVTLVFSRIKEAIGSTSRTPSIMAEKPLYV